MEKKIVSELQRIVASESSGDVQQLSCSQEIYFQVMRHPRMLKYAIQQITHRVSQDSTRIHRQLQRHTEAVAASELFSASAACVHAVALG